MQFHIWSVSAIDSWIIQETQKWVFSITNYNKWVFCITNYQLVTYRHNKVPYGNGRVYTI
jgi:hypothetical protein